MLKKILRFLTAAGILSFSWVSIDIFNIPQQVRLNLANRDALTVTEWHTSVPPCAFDSRIRLVGRPTFFANLFESLDGNRRLVESARRNVALEASTLDDERASPVHWLVLFRKHGYRVDFEFARLLPTEKRHQSAGRDCNADNLITKPERFSVSCPSLASTLQNKIAAVTNTDSADLYWYSYDYTLDRRRLSLDFTSTYCRPHGEL